MANIYDRLYNLSESILVVVVAVCPASSNRLGLVDLPSTTQSFVFPILCSSSAVTHTFHLCYPVRGSPIALKRIEAHLWSIRTGEQNFQPNQTTDKQPRYNRSLCAAGRLCVLWISSENKVCPESSKRVRFVTLLHGRLFRSNRVGRIRNVWLWLHVVLVYSLSLFAAVRSDRCVACYPFRSRPHSYSQTVCVSVYVWSERIYGRHMGEIFSN